MNVKAETNDPDALLNALKHGHFYSSCGPEIYNLEIEKSFARISSSKVKTVIALGYGSSSNVIHGDGLTSVELSLEPFFNSKWLRFVVIDKNGKRAWTNPIWKS